MKALLAMEIDDDFDGCVAHWDDYDEFNKIVKDWLAHGEAPKTGRLYTEMVYQPMLELLRLSARKRLQNFHRVRRRGRDHCVALPNRRTGFRRSRSSVAAAK